MSFSSPKNSWKPLAIITRRSILDVAAALDPPLILFSWQKRRHRWLQNSFRILPIKVTFHFKIIWQLDYNPRISWKKTKRENIYVAAEKYQRKRKNERKWRANKETGGRIRELKTGRLDTYWPNWKSYLHLTFV